MNRLSFAGKGSILIKAAVEGRYGTERYLADEPIAYFTEVMIEVAFNNSDKTARQGTASLVADSKSEPSFLRVSGIKSTESLQSLLYKKQNGGLKEYTETKSLVAKEGEIYLPVAANEEIKEPIFLYDQYKNRVETFTFVELDKKITGLDDKRYTVFYKVQKEVKSTFQLTTPETANLKIEVFIDGNIGGKTGKAVLNLSKTKLLSRPELNFNNDEPFVDELEFIILDSKDTPEVNYYGNT